MSSRNRTEWTIDERMPTDQNAPDASRPSARRRRDDRAAAQAPAAGARVLPARAGRSRRLVRLHLPDRGGHPPAVGEGAAPPRGEARRHRPAISRPAPSSTPAEARELRLDRPRARDPARRVGRTSRRRCAQVARRGDRGRRPRLGAARAASRSPTLAQERGELRRGGRAARGGARGRAVRAGRARRHLLAARRARTPLPGRTQRCGRALRALPRGGRRRRTTPALEARYATLLSYALSDMGELARAEEVVRHALERVEGHRGSVHARPALLVDGAARARRGPSVGRAHERAQGDRAAPGDRRHASTSRAHTSLAANITLSRDDADAAAASSRPRRAPARRARRRRRTSSRSTIRRSRVATLRGRRRRRRVALAREALELVGERTRRSTEGLALVRARATALALAGEHGGRRRGVPPGGRRCSRRRDAGATPRTACRAWGRMLREAGREEQALDVLERAAELGMKAAPAETHAER